MNTIRIKRVYEKAATDEYRILVDRLWPRGLTKERAAIDLWLKEIAPSTELRKWFGHDPEKFLEFRTRYVAELTQNPAVAIISNLLTEHKNIVLVYAAKSEVTNHAIVLKGFIESI
ncbi:uncharacterized protein YeaO (DUF488 family) [Nitrosomonas sp. Nm84]|uniref:DUF488 domain-containing protein n=1 Tax=Nitrosomonas sp. Nm84 TaxID=200124 RepID=UPI000D755B8D|nr:DUF488 domain-containing protein [Nitrosomonas sp. Nm84]PXW86116.1 uncharacterized protein YeaO (DUF488 family) [Nitrosomonas sp. Nm84]